MSADRSTVEAVVKTYFDGLYEGDADKLGAIFDTSADLRWLEKGELQVLTVPDWLDRVRKRPSAKAEGKPREDFIVTIDRSDDQTAFIKVRCQLPPRYFTDYLVAMKLTDGWKIVSKSYRYDLREITSGPCALAGVRLRAVLLRLGRCTRRAASSAASDVPSVLHPPLEGAGRLIWSASKCLKRRPRVRSCVAACRAVHAGADHPDPARACA